MEAISNEHQHGLLHNNDNQADKHSESVVIKQEVLHETESQLLLMTVSYGDYRAVLPDARVVVEVAGDPNHSVPYTDNRTAIPDVRVASDTNHSVPYTNDRVVIPDSRVAVEVAGDQNHSEPYTDNRTILSDARIVVEVAGDPNHSVPYIDSRAMIPDARAAVEIAGDTNHSVTFTNDRAVLPNARVAGDASVLMQEDVNKENIDSSKVGMGSTKTGKECISQTNNKNTDPTKGSNNAIESNFVLRRGIEIDIKTNAKADTKNPIKVNIVGNKEIQNIDSIYDTEEKMEINDIVQPEYDALTDVEDASLSESDSEEDEDYKISKKKRGKRKCTDEFQCHTCGRKFKYKSVYEKHISNSCPRGPYYCKICNQVFKHSSQASAHRRLHSDQQPFQCDICDKKFNYQHALTTHRRIILTKDRSNVQNVVWGSNTKALFTSTGAFTRELNLTSATIVEKPITKSRC